MKTNFGKNFKEQSKKFTRNVKTKLRNGVQWVIENKELVMVLAPVVIGGAATILRVAGKRANLRKEQALKENYCYDRSLGHYWKLNRKLTNSEWVKIEQRRKNGERLADILLSMRVLH